MAEENSSTIELTADVVAAYVANNNVSAADLPALIDKVYAALTSVGQPLEESPEAAIKLTAAQIRKSITPDALISFEDGKGYKTLKRHLTGRGLTLQSYKAKWGLPKDYPTTAPSYSARRSEMARSLGLGRKRAEPIKGGAKPRSRTNAGTT